MNAYELPMNAHEVLGTAEAVLVGTGPRLRQPASSESGADELGRA